MSNKRPVRSAVEQATGRVPTGPLRLVGGGRLIGGTGYFTISFINGVVPLHGVDVGFTVESHNVERSRSSETHTFTIHSASKDVAKFIAVFRSSPSNIQSLMDRPSIQEVTEEESNRTFSRWRVTTVVEKDDDIQELMA